MRIRHGFSRAISLTTALFLALMLPVVPPAPVPALADGELAVIRVSEIQYRGGPEDGAWITFGLPLADGELLDGEEVQVGDATQMDVKSRYPSGCVKFAAVHTKVYEAGDYAVTKVGRFSSPVRRRGGVPGSKSSKGLESSKELPVPSVTPLGGGGGGPTASSGGQPKVFLEVWQGEESTLYTAELSKDIPEFPSDAWWGWPDGDDLYEDDWVFSWRQVSTPLDGDGNPHPFLEVVWDIRLYGLKAVQVRVTVNNIRHEAGDAVWYRSWGETQTGERFFEQPGFLQGYLTQASLLNEIFDLRVEPGQVVLGAKAIWTWDPEPGKRAKAYPRYNPTIVDDERYYFDEADPKFGPGGEGYVYWNMPDHGEREYGVTSPALDRAGARFVTFPNPDMQKFVLKQGDLVASWPMHVLKGGRFVSTYQDPYYWMDARAEPGDKPAGNFPGGCGRLIWDLAHQSSWAFLPFLITSDRFYADQMMHAANDVELRTFNDRFYAGRGRNGEGWVIQPWNGGQDARDVRALMREAEAAAWLPTDDSLLGQFREYVQVKLENNLRRADTDLRASFPPFGPHPYSMGDYLDISPYYIYSCSWIIESIAATLHQINRMGFPGGEEWQRDQAEFKLAYFDPENPDIWRKAGPYRTPLGERIPPGSPNIRWFTTIEEIADAGGYSEYNGFYGVHTLDRLKTARALGMEGAQEAVDYIQGIITEPIYCCRESGRFYSDLGNRSEWAIDDSSYAD